MIKEIKTETVLEYISLQRSNWR